jgi:hypothetical protein
MLMEDLDVLNAKTSAAFELNRENYSLVLPLDLFGNKLVVQIFGLNLKIDHQQKQLRPEFSFLRVVK